MVGIPGLLKSSDKKKGVFLIQDEPPTHPIGASPVRVILYPDTAKSCATIIAYVELVIGPTCLILLGDPGLSWGRYLDQLMASEEIASEDLPMASTVGALILRYFSAILLLFGIIKNKPSWAAPYLMVEIFIMFAGPFAFLYSMSGSEPGTYNTISWVTLTPLVFIGIWFEYVKWRCVYNFYDASSVKHDKSEFAKCIKRDLPSDKAKEAVKIENDWYQKQQLEEIDEGEAEALVPTNDDLKIAQNSGKTIIA